MDENTEENTRASSKELSRNKIKELVEKYTHSKGEDFSEKDTIAHFILPLLESLGWNINDVHEVKQEGYPRNLLKSIPIESRPMDFPDCVLSLKRNPYIVLEFKRLTYGTIDRDQRQINKLLAKAEILNAKYAVLTRFTETIVYDAADGTELIRFSNPTEYLSRFEELWKYLSKKFFYVFPVPVRDNHKFPCL